MDGGHQFSRLLAAEVCASTVVMLDTPCSEVVWRVLATHSIRQFPLHFPSRASPCAIIFQLNSTIPNTSYWDLIIIIIIIIVGVESAVVTGYGLNGRGSNPGGGEIFRTHPDWPWEHPASSAMCTEVLPV
jgi:hypothetical protein